MKGCRSWRNRIPEAVYGELDAKTREKMARHLSGCPGCAALYERIAAAVRSMEIRPAPDREPQFWEGYWDRLEARMALETAAAEGGPTERKARRAEKGRRFHGPAGLPAWAYAAAGALLFISLGVFLGRTLFSPRTELMPVARTSPSRSVRSGRAALETEPAAASLAARASRYLKRSRVLLLAVVNSDPRDDDPFKLNLALQKRTSQALLEEAAVLKKGLRSSDRRLERLVSDLEWILIQIAHLTPDAEVSGIEVIKAGVESRDILFKINLNEVRRTPGKSSSGRAPGAWGEPHGPALGKAAAAA